MKSTFVYALGALALLAACSKDTGKAATPRDAVLDAWKADKHVPAAPLAAATVDRGSGFELLETAPGYVKGEKS